MNEINRPKEDVLERNLVREVVGIVEDAPQLDKVLGRLIEGGFDRSDIHLMATREAALEKLGTIADALVTPASDGVLRDSLTSEDALSGLVLIFGALITIGSLGAAAVVASGGAIAAATVAATAGGAVGTGLARLIRDHVISDRDADDLEEELSSGGLAVLVRVRLTDQARWATTILLDCGAQNVRLHQVILSKKTTATADGHP